MDSLPQSGYKRNAALGLSSKPLIHQGKGCSGVSCGPDVGHRGGNAQGRVVLGQLNRVTKRAEETSDPGCCT